jgi:hypothetical protein
MMTTSTAGFEFDWSAMRFPVYCLRCRIIKLLGLLLLASLLQACSFVKVAYNQAPELAYLYLDNYVDFNGAQSIQIKDELTKLQVWHRQTQLPLYVDTLQKLQQQMPSSMDSTQACELFADVRSKLLAVSDYAEPAALAMAGTLSPEQLTRMERKFAKGNADYVDDFIEATPKASRNKRYKQAVSRAEMLYGSLGDKQLAVIGQSIEQSRFDARLSYTERLRRQRDALESLRLLVASKSAGADTLEKTRTVIRGLFNRSLNSPSTAYSEQLEKMTLDTCKGFADLHNSTTPAQRARAVEILKGYENDMKALMGKS